jgi:hypothetical protein
LAGGVVCIIVIFSFSLRLRRLIFTKNWSSICMKRL